MALRNLVQLLLHINLMALLLPCHLLLMLSPFHVHLLLEHLAVLVLSRLQLLEEGRVLQHFRAVFVTLLFQFNLLAVEKFFSLVSIVCLRLAFVLL